MTGIEPVTSSLPRKCSTNWATSAFQSERETRLELATNSLEGCDSTNWVTPALNPMNFQLSNYPLFSMLKWVGKDSNLRRQLSTDLQSVAFNHFATYPTILVLLSVLYIKIAKRFIKYQIYLFKSIELLITLLNFSLCLTS